MIEEVVIIGSGPAGYTAGIYAGRAGLGPLMFSGEQPGGQLMITTDVENYPGFPEGVMGPEMMQLFQAQAERFGLKIKNERVAAVDFDAQPFRVSVGDQVTEAKTIIIATGADAKWIGVPGEKEFGGFGVSACATCDGFFFRGKEVIVVGGGDTAMEEANFLTRHASKVYLVHRRAELRASKIMQERAMSNPKIEFVWNTEILEMRGEDGPPRKLKSVLLGSTVDGSQREMPIDGVFVAIGHKPNSELFTKWLDTNELGYLTTQHHSTRTKVPGVFACGDVMDHVYRQAVTAAGTGCMAAIEAERFLEAQTHGG